jgi:hypothetical protein
MKFETKLKLIESYSLTPDEIKFIDSLNINFNESEENFEDLKSKISIKINNLQDSEDTLLQLAYVKSKMGNISINFTSNFEDDEFYEDDFDFEDSDVQEYHNELEVDWKEKRKIQKEAIAKYKKYSQTEIDNLLFEYVWKYYPVIQNGFDRSIFSKAKYAFTDHIGIFSTYEAPESLRLKLSNAEENAKILILNKLKQLENVKFNDWLEEYRQWLAKNGISKCTKTNIKEFFKEKQIKVSDLTIEKIKNYY